MFTDVMCDWFNVYIW